MSGSGGDLNNSSQIEGASDNTLIGNISDSLKVADAEFATFVVFRKAVATANNGSLMSLVNTSSSVKVRLRDVKIVNARTSAATGVAATFDLLRCTGHSSGTSITPESHDTDDSLDGGVTARTGATISGEGTGILRSWTQSTDEWGTGSLDAEAFDRGIQAHLSAYLAQQKTKPITLRQNQGITLKCVTNTTTGLFDVMFVFTQEP